MEQYVNYVTILPEAILSLVAFLIMILDAYSGGKQRKMYAYVALVGYVLAGASIAWLAHEISVGSPVVQAETFSKMLVTDTTRLSFSTIALVVSALTTLVSVSWLDTDDLPAGEFQTLLMFATVGMLLMASAGDLVMIFLGLEILSIATYVMAGFRRRDLRSNEAGLKYYILGSFSTAFLLYGMALTYGATKSTNLIGIRDAIAGGKVEWTWLLLIGAAMMLVGLCFKVAVAPFHVWTPDVYEGAPSVVTGWMSTGPKAAAFSAFLKLYVAVFAVAGGAVLNVSTSTSRSLQVIAVTTMVLGNVVAMVQDNIKRMLAYSSIAHAGYAMVGLLAGDGQAVAFYLLAYAVMNIGAFAVVTTIARRADRETTLDDYRGIGWQSVGLSMALSVFLLSLAGFPMTAGFMGKLLVFKAAWSKGLSMLVVFGVLNSAASVYYYLRPIVLMYFVPSPDGDTRRGPVLSATTVTALALSLIGVFYLGLLPDAVIKFFAFGAR